MPAVRSTGRRRLPALRSVVDRRLRVARRDLAVDENRRTGRRARPRPGQDAAAGRSRLHGRGQPMDAARGAAHRGALVLAAEFLLPVAGAGGDGTHRLSALALAWTRPRSAAVSGDDCAIPARLSRPGDFELSRIWCRPRSPCGTPRRRRRARFSCCSARWCCCR